MKDGDIIEQGNPRQSWLQGGFYADLYKQPGLKKRRNNMA